MQLRPTLIITSVALMATACSINNRSLDYKKTQQIAPLEVPSDVNMRPQQALYPTPQISDGALEQAPNYANRAGNRYAMPRPTDSTPAMGYQAAGKADLTPQLMLDGNDMPLLKVDADPNTVWQYVQAAVSTANLKSSEGKNAFILRVDYDDKPYILRLSQTSASSVLGVYDGKSGKFTDRETANDILTLIYRNWPTQR